MEVTSLGFYSDTTGFTSKVANTDMPLHVINDIFKSVVNNSYNIYKNRNSLQ